MKKLNNASLPLSFAEGKYSSESVNLPEGQYIVKIIATGPCIGKVLKDNEVLAEVDFSSYKTLYNNLSISFILQSESAVSLEVTPKREDVKVYSASLHSSLLPVGKGSGGGGGESEPLCFTSLEDENTFSLNYDISISIDGKQTWQTLAANTPSPVINTGEKIYFKATEDAEIFNPISIYAGYYQFTTLKTCNVSGDPYSLYTKKESKYLKSKYQFASLFKQTKIVDASGLILETELIPQCYYGMFEGCTNLVTAPTLPATTLTYQCYYNMFKSCTSLVTAPELPATTLAQDCYSSMFEGCTSLTTAPALPATTLAQSCYSSMFKSCTSLTTAPALPATTLAHECYYRIFYGCTSLTTAPELPATTLATDCYGYMFYGCTSLNYIKCLALSSAIGQSSCTTSWVTNVSSTGTFVKNKDATVGTGREFGWHPGVNGVPNNWTVEDAA